MRRSLLFAVTTTALACLLVACAKPTPPKGVTVVEPFDAQRFLGQWYEIARFDHRFERGLDNVTATYSLNRDGSINVVNRGFNSARQMWKSAEGTARFTGSPQRAALKVSFFGPFYGGYNVIALDPDYRYAVICGPDRDYLWILSRTPTLDMKTRQTLANEAQRQGFDITRLQWVDQRLNAK